MLKTTRSRFLAVLVLALYGLAWPVMAVGAKPNVPGGFYAIPGKPVAVPTTPARRQVSILPRAEENIELYDRDNPDFATLQNPLEALAGLPLWPDGTVDWVQAIRQGAIKPRAQFKENAKPAVIDLDILMRNTRQMPYVRFPHRAHTEWLSCSNCHPAIFRPKAGANRMRMGDILRGEYCGVCHGKVAFRANQSCERCHNTPWSDEHKSWVPPAKPPAASPGEIWGEIH